VNLLYFSQAYTPHDWRFLSSLTAGGCRVRFLRLSRQRLESRPLPAGVQAVPWVGETRPLRSPVDFLIQAMALRNLLRELNPQAAVAGPIQTAAFLLALSGFRPFVAMSWGSDLLQEADRNFLLRLITRFTLRRAAGFLGDCRAVREKCKRLTTLSDDLIVTFPWGIDHQAFAPAPARLPLRQELGWQTATVFLSTRTWEPLYRIDLLLQAFARVRQSWPEARLLLLGDGSQEAALLGQMTTLGISPFVHMPGRIPQDLLPEFYRLADLYVSSAPSDGTSISLLEAMASGLPVVVADNPSNREWVKPEENGWLYRPNVAPDLAAAMLGALNARQHWGSVGRANRALVQDRADWPRNFPRLLNLLKNITCYRWSTAGDVRTTFMEVDNAGPRGGVTSLQAHPLKSQGRYGQ
jgi:glycosyltransferase involved in cell wall biosynthesis